MRHRFTYRQKTMRADSLEANAWGPYHMHGNVWAWVQDCWHSSYAGAPMDGAARDLDCMQPRRVLRGGSWDEDPTGLRAAVCGTGEQVKSFSFAGFRLAGLRLAGLRLASTL